MRKIEDKKVKKNNPIANILKGSLIGMASSIIILGIVAALITAGRLSESFMQEMTVAACFIGSLIGTVVLVKRTKTRVLLTGVGVGFVMFLVTLLIGALDENSSVGSLTFAIFISMMTGGVLGSIFGATKKKKKRV